MQKLFPTILLLCTITFAYSQQVTLNIRALVQGFYKESGTMVAVIDPEHHPDLCDTMTVCLLDTTAPAYHVLFSTSSVISTTGYGSFAFPAAVLNRTYFIRLTHRNSLTVFGKYRLYFNDPSIYYDFTDSPTLLCQNMTDSPDGFAFMYSGDLNHDGNIDSTDFSMLTNAISSPNPYGYVIEDLTGDQFADIQDIPVLRENLDLPFQLWGGHPNSCLLTGVTKIFSYADNIIMILNPAKDSLMINYHVQDRKDVQIFNWQGKLVATNELEKDNTYKTISLAGFRPGLYGIHFTSEGSTLTKRIMVQR